MKILPRYTIIPSIINKAIKVRKSFEISLISARDRWFIMASPCFKECLLNELNNINRDPLLTHF